MSYKTRDSETAVVLLSQNKRFSSKSESGVIWFSFEDKEGCEAIIDAHINRELPCFTLDMTNALYEIKKIIIRNKTK